MMLPLFMLAGSAALLLGGAAFEFTARKRERKYPVPGRLIAVGGYRVHMRVAGQDDPTVVVVTGAGDPASAWAPVQDAVARFSRIITYDRSGLGRSDAAAPAGCERYVVELRTLLERSGMPGPYVLVGHSLGGLIAQLYASRYPGDVVGMVLVDSSHERMLEIPRLRQLMRISGVLIRLLAVSSSVGLPRVLGEWLGAAVPEQRSLEKRLSPEQRRLWAGDTYRSLRGGLWNEVAALPEVCRQAQAALGRPATGPLFGEMPLVVLTNSAMGEAWIDLQLDLASRSACSTHTTSDIRSHMMHYSQPDLVVASIRRVVEEVQGEARPQVRSPSAPASTR